VSDDEPLQLPSEMRPAEGQAFLAAIAEDRSTVATTAGGAEISSYLRLFGAICDALLAPQELLGVSVVRTKRSAISGAVHLAGSRNPMSFYSANPDLLNNALVFFSNLEDWIGDADEGPVVVPRCPLRGHDDRWDLRVVELDPAGPSPWKVCSRTGERVGRFVW
jgi:hypothetical protein